MQENEIKENIRQIRADISDIKQDFRRPEDWEEWFLKEAFWKTWELLIEIASLKKRHEEFKEKQIMINDDFLKFKKNFNKQVMIIFILIFILYVLYFFLNVWYWIY